MKILAHTVDDLFIVELTRSEVYEIRNSLGRTIDKGTAIDSSQAGKIHHLLLTALNPQAKAANQIGNDPAKVADPGD